MEIRGMLLARYKLFTVNRDHDKTHKVPQINIVVCTEAP